MARVSGKIQELQQAIASLGEVNLGAVEEYTRVKKVEFLSADCRPKRASGVSAGNH